MTDRFSGQVADSPDWNEHIAKLESFLEKSRDLILQAKCDGVSVEADASLHNEDYEHEGYHRTWFELPLSLIRRLGEVGVPFSFVVYNV